MGILIQLLVVCLCVVVALIVARLRRYEYDYSVVPDLLKRKRDEALAASAPLRLLDPLVTVCSAVVTQLRPEAHLARTRRELVRAGHPRGFTAETFAGYCLALSVLTYTVVFALYLLFAQSLRPLPGILPALIAYLVPHMNLRNEAARRQVVIDRQIPYFLDLVSLTMAAGSTFLQACETILRGGTGGPLQEEVAIMLHEVRAGVTLDEALANLTRRSDSEELGLMVQAVRQGEELGTPLVEVLENQATMNRYRRSQKGEQTAAKLPNRLAVPNTVMMLAVLLLLFGPIIVKAVRGGFM